MDLNSTSCTSDDLVFRMKYDVCQCRAGFFKNGWNGGILFHDYNQGLSRYRSKWLGEGQGYGRLLFFFPTLAQTQTSNSTPTLSRVRIRVRVRVALTLTVNLK